MSKKPSISQNKLSVVKDLYINKKLPMSAVAKHFRVSLDSVVYFFRKNDILRRTYKEAQQVSFERKKPSFVKNSINTPKLKELLVIGSMLYWAEGYKGNDKATTVDFANSDSSMIRIFLVFLRSVFHVNEKKFRIYLYCYSNQDKNKLINFWSKTTGIPRKQFSKPYVRSDFREGGRKMEHGMIHIRYHDKKLLLEIKNMIQSYVQKYAPIA